MKRELIIRAMAGTLVLASIWLSHNVNASFMWLTVFVGANLLQSAFTGFCPVEMILKKLNIGK